MARRQARMTEAGARRLRRPDLVDAVVEVTPSRHSPTLAGKVFHNNVLIAREMQFSSKGPGDPPSLEEE